MPPALYQLLLRSLARLDGYLRSPLEHELARDPQLRESRRRFLDGDRLTLADCGLLPKLHIVDVRAGGRGRAPRGRVRALDTLTELAPPADGVRALPRGARTRAAVRGPALPGQRAAAEGVQVHLPAQLRDPGGLPARGAPPLAPQLRASSRLCSCAQPTPGDQRAAIPATPDPHPRLRSR